MRRTKGISTNQLDLFSSNYKDMAKVDYLIDILMNQAANTRYLITRVTYCGELSLMDNIHSLSLVLNGYRDLCESLKQKSTKYTKTNFHKLWHPLDVGAPTDPDAYPDKESVLSHWSNCINRLKTVKLSHSTYLKGYGTIVDNIQNNYQLKNYL